MTTDEAFSGLLPFGNDEEGTRFVQELYQRTIWQDDSYAEYWPTGYSKLFRLYKKASRDFLRLLFKAVIDIIPWTDLVQLARVVPSSWEGEEWEVQLPEGFPAHPYIIFVDAVALHSTQERIRPEMVLALQTEVAARRLVDAWWKDVREALPYRRKAYARGERHERWTEMLAERLEILRPEYERWNDNAEASLTAVCDAMARIGLEE